MFSARGLMAELEDDDDPGIPDDDKIARQAEEHDEALLKQTPDNPLGCMGGCLLAGLAIFVAPTWYFLGPGWAKVGGAVAVLGALYGLWHTVSENRALREKQKALRASRARAEAHLEALVEKYGAEVAEKIIFEKVWMGATADMVRDALGRPEDVDQKVSKRGSRETWKYHRTGKGRFALKVSLDDGVVTGWEGKVEG